VTFSEQLKLVRKAANLSQKQLAELAALSQASLAQWETGARDQISYEAMIRLESALSLQYGDLAAYLPADHPTRRQYDVTAPVRGYVEAGQGTDEPIHCKYLRVAESFAGCVAYEVRGKSMLPELIGDKDYLLVWPTEKRAPQAGDIVVAYIARGGGGHVVKKLSSGGVLQSSGGGRWKHTLGDGDYILGVLAGVIRFVTT
jgi:transcriptional regulator with XRE-family HTH domain